MIRAASTGIWSWITDYTPEAITDCFVNNPPPAARTQQPLRALLRAYFKIMRISKIEGRKPIAIKPQSRSRGLYMERGMLSPVWLLQAERYASN
jgi:hypothetical protein